MLLHKLLVLGILVSFPVFHRRFEVDTNNISGFLPKILQLCQTKKLFFVKNVSRETIMKNKDQEA